MIKLEHTVLASPEMSEHNYERCNGCPYYFGEIDQCMVGEDDVPDNLEKKCKKEAKKK
nr:MAG TPA: hypothetical protein [Bacteriophage sp.]